MLRALALSAFLVTLAACTAREKAETPPKRIPEKVLSVLRNATAIELFAVEPQPVQETTPGVDVLQRWPILGKTEITEAAIREQVLKAIEQGTTEPGLDPAACFDPHHGLRATHEGVTVEIVICFLCSRMSIYVDGQKTPGTLISKSPERVLDKILQDRGAFPKPES